MHGYRRRYCVGLLISMVGWLVGGAAGCGDDGGTVVGLPECGNGVVELGETCDGDCPTSCDDDNACTDDVLAGSESSCNVTCTHTPVSSCADGDGCCPAGCNAAQDDDCAVACGNGVVESGETCDGNCPFSCDDGNPCTDDTMTGSAATCDVQCTHTPVSSCAAEDGCCPAGCDSSTDGDCSAYCGNGVVDTGETCDGNCPASCDDGVDCTQDVLTGSAATCSAACGHVPITLCVSGDGCCAPGCSAAADSDCTAVCGNSIVDPGELCDGDCPVDCNDGNACTADALTGSAASCDAQCAHTPITQCASGDGCCPGGCTSTTDSDCGGGGTGPTGPVCGDGVAEGNEACDGDDLRGLSCLDLGYGGPGILSCYAHCQYNTTCCTDYQWVSQIAPRTFGTDSYWYEEADAVLDGQGHPRIMVYVNGGGLYYLTWDGTDWAMDAVDTSTNVGRWAALALDSQGDPHVSYYDTTNAQLKYASWNGSGWDVEVVDDTDDMGPHSDLVLDSQDRPHIVYRNETTLGLRYASWNGAAWDLSDIEVGLGSVSWASAAVDSQDRVWVAYYADRAYPPGDQFNVGYYDGSAWVLEHENHSSSYYMVHNDLILDSRDQPRLAYFSLNTYSSAVVYRYFDLAQWSTSVLFSSDTGGGWTSIALDPDDRPYVVGFDEDDTNGDYVYLGVWDVSDWTLEPIGPGYTGEGSRVRVMLDAQRRPHVVWEDGNYNVRYVHLSCR